MYIYIYIYVYIHNVDVYLLLMVGYKSVALKATSLFGAHFSF